MSPLGEKLQPLRLYAQEHESRSGEDARFESSRTASRRGLNALCAAEDFDKDDIKLTTLVSKAGVPTACYVNYTLYDNCAAVGETKPTDCGHEGKCYDEDVIPLLERNLATTSPGTDSSCCILAAAVMVRS